MAWKESASAAMDRYAQGDDAAFSELYDLLAPRLTAFLLRRTRDPSRVEDLVQQTFLQMHGARRHFARGSDVTPWAFAILRRLVIDAFRKDERGSAVRDREGDARAEVGACEAPGASPDEIAARRRLARRIDEELARVSPSDRVAFQLVVIDGLSTAEAGKILGTTANAVKLRAHRAYVALRARLGDEVREQIEGSW